jgi:hypothetical protein
MLSILNHVQCLQRLRKVFTVATEQMSNSAEEKTPRRTENKKSERNMSVYHLTGTATLMYWPDSWSGYLTHRISLTASK